jgi:hypothetical protein
MLKFIMLSLFDIIFCYNFVIIFPFIFTEKKRDRILERLQQAVKKVLNSADGPDLYTHLKSTQNKPWHTCQAR